MNLVWLYELLYDRFVLFMNCCILTGLFCPPVGTVVVDGHRVTKPDMSATNGVVHKLDYVLIPSSLATQIKNL